MPQFINDDKIGNAFNSLFQIISSMEANEDEDVVWDFSKTIFVTPFFLLPLMLYKKQCGKNVECKNISTTLQSYFTTVHFDKGLTPEELNDGFSKYMESYSGKTYIPIINFPASEAQNDIKGDILSVVENILIKQLGVKGEMRGALSYMLSETIDNITEHSFCDRGYIFAQYYPSRKYIDICIADNGITLLGSYLKAKKEGITNDLEAIKNAGTGVSTKNLPDAENRGYGITTCKKMLAKGLKGTYFLFSGQAFHTMKEEESSYVGLPDNVKWDGTIVALRIPYSENKDFKYLDYVE